MILNMGLGAVGRIGLAGLDEERVSQIENGDVSVNGLFLLGGDSWHRTPKDESFMPMALIEVNGISYAPVDQFMEVKPVDPSL